jgi:flagellar biosynthetic protein FliO
MIPERLVTALKERHRPTPVVAGAIALVALFVVVLIGQSMRPSSPTLSETGHPLSSGAPAARLGTGAADLDLPSTAADVTVKLILVLGVAYGSLALLRRYGRGVAWGRTGSRIEIVEATALASNRQIYLVRVSDKQLLLGVTPTQITTLAEWDGGADEQTADQYPRTVRSGADG